MDEKVNKDNLLQENVEKQVEESAVDKKEEIKKKLIIHYKKCAMGIIALAILIMAVIAWFTKPDGVKTSGMSVTLSDSPFDLKSIGSDGLYDEFMDDITTGFENETTTVGSSGIKWNLTSTSQMNNLYEGSGELTTEKFGEITRSDSEEYGLKPGDSGKLDFSIVPNSPPVSLTMNLNVKGYEATFDNTSHKTDDPLVEVTNATVDNYMHSHILFFYKGTDNKKHMLTSEGFDADNITVETAKTIYWVWIPTLQQILDANIESLGDVDASKEVRRYFFENPDKFLKATGNVSFAAFTVTKNDDVVAEEAEIEEKKDFVSGRNYSTYGAMYNDADQSIGDHINYVLVELTALLK